MAIQVEIGKSPSQSRSQCRNSQFCQNYKFPSVLNIRCFKTWKKRDFSVRAQCQTKKKVFRVKPEGLLFCRTYETAKNSNKTFAQSKFLISWPSNNPLWKGNTGLEKKRNFTQPTITGSKDYNLTEMQARLNKALENTGDLGRNLNENYRFTKQGNAQSAASGFGIYKWWSRSRSEFFSHKPTRANSAKIFCYWRE